jgi:hypothetical protein
MHGAGQFFGPTGGDALRDRFWSSLEAGSKVHSPFKTSQGPKLAICLVACEGIFPLSGDLGKGYLVARLEGHGAAKNSSLLFRLAPRH